MRTTEQMFGELEREERRANKDLDQAEQPLVRFVAWLYLCGLTAFRHNLETARSWRLL